MDNLLSSLGITLCVNW